MKRVQHELSVILRQPYTTSQNQSSRPGQSASDESQTKERRNFELSTEDLKKSAESDTEKFLYPTGMKQKPLQRHAYIDKVDTDLNVYVESNVLANVALGSLAEVLKCFMLLLRLPYDLQSI